MPFIHPALFWGGAAAASTPIIIHLLNRRRFKVLDWAAMKFLLESVRRNRRRIRIEEIILLALRCLAILLLALAVSRLAGCVGAGAAPIIGEGARTEHVFILDDSVSMGQKIGDSTSFAKAIGELTEMIDKLSGSDRMAVVFTSRPKDQSAISTLQSVSELVSPGGYLKTLQPSDTAGGLGQALERVSGMFTGASAKQLYILSDFRQLDYDAESADALRRELEPLVADGVKLSLLSYGAAPGVNLTIESIEILDRSVLADVPATVRVKVRNNGREPVSDATVQFSACGVDTPQAKLPVRTIRSIEPGDEEVVEATYTFAEAGSGVIVASLRADCLSGDNSAQLAVNVRDSRKVLIIDGEPNVSSPLDAETIFLKVGLDPSGDHKYGSAVDIVPADRIGDVNFGGYDAVILANVGELPKTFDAEGKLSYGALKELTSYVRGGGGLAIFTGDRINLAFYRGEFYDKGKGLCPLQVKPHEGDPRDRQKYVRLLGASIKPHQVMSCFQGGGGNFLKMLRFYAFTPSEVALPAASGDIGRVNVLARFSNDQGHDKHSPAIVSRSFGRGWVVMVCTSADREWNDWANDPTYLPFINDMVGFIVRLSVKDYTAVVGEPIAYGLEQGMLGAKVVLRTPHFPDEDEMALEPVTVETQRLISFEDTRHAGVYRLTLDLAGEAKTVLLARNVDPREGQLEVADENTLRAALQTELRYMDRLAPVVASATAATEGAEYWKAAMLAMLLVLGVEVFLGQRFGHYS